eukprot:403375380
MQELSILSLLAFNNGKQKALNEDESVNTVDTQFSSNSNHLSIQTINAYGIKIAEALEVIEIEEKAKTQADQNTTILQQHLNQLLGKRKQPEPYMQAQAPTAQVLLDQIKNSQNQFYNQGGFLGYNQQVPQIGSVLGLPLIGMTQNSNSLLQSAQKTINSYNPQVLAIQQQVLNRRFFNSQKDIIQTANPQKYYQTLSTQPSDLQPTLTSLATRPLNTDQSCTQRKLSETRNEILNQLPHQMGIQKQCLVGCNCQINKNLLEYFVQNELLKLQSPTKILEVAKQQPESSLRLDFTDNTLLQQNFETKHNDLECVTNQQQILGQNLDQLSKNQNENLQDSAQKVMAITKCPHVNRKHYAKNMCSSCYRKYGRNQNAWNCVHHDRLLYSMGMCQTCYLSDYHKRKCKSSAVAPDAESDLQTVQDISNNNCN